MPEMPDVLIYLEAIERYAVDQVLKKVRIYRPFVLRTFDPPIDSAEGHRLVGVKRMGKRLALRFEGDLHIVIHLMIAGRMLWSEKPPAKPNKMHQASFEFEHGTLVLTEAGTKRRASIHVVSEADGLAALDPGGIDPITATSKQFAAALLAENRTLKRALTQPNRFSGIGNAYSDEILFEARLSPLRLTTSLSEDDIERLRIATRDTLTHWIEKLRSEFGERFPGMGEVTAFREDFNVHGRFGKPCRVCGMPIQRIVHSENEINYCARCQNQDRVLADRALSRLLKSDWPTAFLLYYNDEIHSDD
ncbi:MAG: formamidopyrimidine-DNA glycosylase [Armatimonadetes bacterium]|nr:formamidopyrimidine-DNA glycosylase [Armatimonadota bacterium]